MSEIQATNNFVFIERHETISEKAGLVIPDGGQKKPNTGTVYSVGNLVKDKKIKKGKSAIWHDGAGMEVPYEDKTYLVIEGERIIAVV